MTQQEIDSLEVGSIIRFNEGKVTSPEWVYGIVVQIKGLERIYEGKPFVEYFMFWGDLDSKLYPKPGSAFLYPYWELVHV